MIVTIVDDLVQNKTFHQSLIKKFQTAIAAYDKSENNIVTQMFSGTTMFLDAYTSRPKNDFSLVIMAASENSISLQNILERIGPQLIFVGVLSAKESRVSNLKYTKSFKNIISIDSNLEQYVKILDIGVKAYEQKIKSESSDLIKCEKNITDLQLKSDTSDLLVDGNIITTKFSSLFGRIILILNYEKGIDDEISRNSSIQNNKEIDLRILFSDQRCKHELLIDSKKINAIEYELFENVISLDYCATTFNRLIRAIKNGENMTDFLVFKSANGPITYLTNLQNLNWASSCISVIKQKEDSVENLSSNLQNSTSIEFISKKAILLIKF